MPSVGSLYATLSLDDQQYQDALKKAPGVASQTAAKINTAFARNPGIDNAAKGIAGLTSDLKIQAGALGLSAGAFNKLSAAGSQLGVSQAQIIRTVAGVRGQLDLARAGVEPNVAAFRELGLNWRSLARARPDAALAQVARATFLAGEGTKAYNTGLRILGADALPKAQGFFRQLARGDLPAVAAATDKTAAGFTRGLQPAIVSTFLRVAGPVALLGTLKSLSSAALTLGANLTQQASAVGLTTSRYQTLEFVARENNAAAQDLISATSQLRVNLRNAADGSETDRRKFEDLGLSWRDLISLAPDEALERVARATRSADTDTRIFGAGARLLGTDTFPKLRGALNAIAKDGLPALDAALEKTGGKLSDEATKRLNEAEKALERFKRGVVTFIGERIASVQLISSGELEKLSDAEIALKRLLDARLRLQQLGPATVVSLPPAVAPGQAPIPPIANNPAEELDAARVAFAKIAADATQEISETLLFAAKKALQDYAASLRERGKLTAAATTEIESLETALAKRTQQLAAKTAAAQKKATDDRLKAERDAADQRARIEQATSDRVTGILDEGEKKRLRTALDTAGQIKSIEGDIAAARAVAQSTPDTRATAAARLKALEEQIAALKAEPPPREARIPGATELLNLEKQIENARRVSVTSGDEKQRVAAAEALVRLEAERRALLGESDPRIDHSKEILDLEKQIAAARAVAEAAPTDRTAAAEKLNSLLDERASLLAAETAETKRTRDEMEAQAAAIIATVDPLARYRRAVEEINKLHDAGLLTLQQWQKAIADARADLTKANVDNLVSGLRTATDQANAIASTIAGIGSSALSDLRDKAGIAGTAGSSRTQRSIEKNLAKAEEAAARGNTGASDQFLRRAQELAGNVGGTTAANVLGSQITGQPVPGPRRIDPGSNEGHALAMAQRLADFTAGNLPNLAPTTVLTPVGPPGAPTSKEARGAALGGIGTPTVPPEQPKSPAPGGDLTGQIAELVKALNDIAGRLETD